jgi:succinate dehydrogenase / fumarate reductase cytochrome b subunit
MSNSGLGKSSIGRKLVMALSGLFLLVFLLQHLVINALSVISPDSFNEVSHFMGTNGIIQFAMQPVLIGGIIIHYIMGILLTIQNKKARPIGYLVDNQAANSSWISRNMIFTGLMILAFIVVHFIDFWIPEVKLKFVDGDWSGIHDGVEGTRYIHHLREVFTGTRGMVKGVVYTIAFIFLGLHLAHGFASTFQSVGFRHGKYTPTLVKVGKAYSVIVPLLFAAIVWFHVLCAGSCAAH